MINHKLLKYGILTLSILALSFSLGIAKPKAKKTTGSSVPAQGIQTQPENVPGTPSHKALSRDTAKKGRGNPHLEGEQGNPHQAGMTGDPHQQEGPGKGKGNPHVEGTTGNPHQAGMTGDPHQQVSKKKVQSKKTKKTQTQSVQTTGGVQFHKPTTLGNQPSGIPGSQSTPNQVEPSNNKKFRTPKK